jgi:uncharacterized protein
MDMNGELFPLAFASDEMRLLTALVIGFMFGFVLERGGFGNARKLAGQFYLTDMTVFKVMFTAILVAMAGLYILDGVGLVDMARMWVNPTFMWAQVVGGFLLGVGFIMSGLCPGTAVVAAASGRWDGAVTIAGIFLGMAAFALAIDMVPGVEVLYGAGDMGVSVLPAVFGIPTLWFVLLVVVMAGAAFVGAEKVESIFGPHRAPVELTPAHRPRAKFAVAGALVLSLATGLAFRAAPHAPPEPGMETIEPAAVAERLIAGDANLLVIDVRAAPESLFPMAFSAALDGSARGGAGVDDAAVDDAALDGAVDRWRGARWRGDRRTRIRRCVHGCPAHRPGRHPGPRSVELAVARPIPGTPRRMGRLARTGAYARDPHGIHRRGGRPRTAAERRGRIFLRDCRRCTGGRAPCAHAGGRERRRPA